MPFTRLLLLAAALLCVAPALPSGSPAPTASTSSELATTAAFDDARPEATPTGDPLPVLPRVEVPSPLPAPSESPAPDPTGSAATSPVTPLRVAVRVDSAPGDAVDRVMGLEGVAHATAVRVGRLAVDGDDHLDVAAVDPDGFRPFTPEVVAGEPGVWARIDEGALAITHEHADRLGLPLGEDVALGGVPVRVGAFASNGLPPVADAIVNVTEAPRLGLDTVDPTLLVGLVEGAEAGSVADRVEEALGADAIVVPDPRAPRSVTPAPPQGDTVWDVLAGCESSGDWHANTGNGFYGGLQFLPESWWLVGGSGMPHEASREEQIARAERLLELQGWRAWPVCSIRVGLRPDPGAG